MSTLTTDEVNERIIDTLAAAGFVPVDGDEFKVGLDWLERYGVDAYRQEDGGMVTLVRWDGEMTTIRLAFTTMNNFIYSEAEFRTDTKGLAWFAAAVQS